MQAEPQLSVREMESSDIPLIAAYWTTSDPSYLQSLGVDLQKVPAAEHFISMLEAQLALPIEKRNAYCLIWEIDGEPVGHCNTNPTVYGDHAWMHLHLWSAKWRRQGIGSRLLLKSIPIFFGKLELKRLFSQPYAENAAPHAALQKAGFRKTGEAITIPGSINFEQKVYQWELNNPSV